MKITIKHVFNNQILLTFMNRFIRYYGIIFSIIWMAIYNLLIMPYYEIGDFRLHLFLGVILGLSSNLIEHRAKYLQIALSITIYILIGTLYDWYFYINDKIIMSPHSYLNLFVSGHISLNDIRSYSTQYLLAIDIKTITVFATSIFALIATSFIDFKKVGASLDYKVFFTKEGFISILLAVFVWSLVFFIDSALNEKSFYESLPESQKINFPNPRSFSFILFLNIFVFSFVRIYSLYLLSIKTKLNKTIIAFLYCIIVLLLHFFISLLAGSVTKYSCQVFFDNTIFNVIEVFLIIILLLRYKPIIAFITTILGVWFLNIIYQSYLYAPQNILSSFISEISKIYIPLLASLLASITYIVINRLWNSKK